MAALRLRVLPDRLAICRLAADAPVPARMMETGFVSLTRTADELSIVCREDLIPHGARAHAGWRALEVVGPLDLSLTGIAARLTRPLADAQIPVFIVSTFDTDYLLVQGDDLATSAAALRSDGHDVASPG